MTTLNYTVELAPASMLGIMTGRVPAYATPSIVIEPSTSVVSGGRNVESLSCSRGRKDRELTLRCCECDTAV